MDLCYHFRLGHIFIHTVLFFLICLFVRYTFFLILFDLFFSHIYIYIYISSVFCSCLSRFLFFFISLIYSSREQRMGEQRKYSLSNIIIYAERLVFFSVLSSSFIFSLYSSLITKLDFPLVISSICIKVF